MFDIAILGAGASGLALVNRIYNCNKKICIIDANSKIAQKVSISGGGKCNFTNENLSSSKYIGDKRLIEHTFKNFSHQDLLNIFDNNLTPYKLHERLIKGAYFCYDSKDIISIFSQSLKKITQILDTKVLDLDFIDNVFHIKTDKETIFAKKFVVASGGLSFAILNASDIGYKIAEKFKHTIIKTYPALVGFSVQKEQFWFKELSGLSIKDVCINIGKKKIVGDFLFTHRGCSGPSVLVSSLYWQKGAINVDFTNSKEKLPKRFLDAFRKNSNMPLDNYSFSPAGTLGYSKAEVTKGGVSTKELDKSLQSKYQKNLYFIGEVLDVTGELGGYNIQWAISSAYKINLKKLLD